MARHPYPTKFLAFVLAVGLVLACHSRPAGAGDDKSPFLKGRHKGTILTMAFSPNGKWLATGGGILVVGNSAAYGEVRLWDVATRAERFSLEGHKEMVYAVAFSPDSKLLASGGADGKVDGPTLILWDPETGKQ